MAGQDGYARITVRVPPSVHELLKKACQRSGLSQAEFIETSLKQAVQTAAERNVFSASAQAFESEVMRLSQQANAIAKGDA